MRTVTITIPAELGIHAPADMPLIELFSALHAAGHRLKNDGKYNLIAVPIRRKRPEDMMRNDAVDPSDFDIAPSYRPPLADDEPCEDCGEKWMHCKCSINKHYE